ncbi:hypothetical protein IWQ60_011994 [Tieghemiomyces parasiticus]|uniref:C2H2-type domain-containing protein n=1 Tax=Tieghemiomyces parasiticus TaxID=78921 RepID=A0A9W7ZN01_9FUNG|nr:hypothetical protein IWQ60_011994 [Tieghemiomyces parasiticus]
MAPDSFNEGYSDLRITFDGNDGFVIDSLGQPWLLGGAPGMDGPQHRSASSPVSPNHPDYYSQAAQRLNSGLNAGQSLNSLSGGSQATAQRDGTMSLSNNAGLANNQMYMSYADGSAGTAHSGNGLAAAASSLASSGILNPNMTGNSGLPEYSNYCYVNADSYDSQPNANAGMTAATVAAMTNGAGQSRQYLSSAPNSSSQPSTPHTASSNSQAASMAASQAMATSSVSSAAAAAYAQQVGYPMHSGVGSASTASLDTPSFPSLTDGAFPHHGVSLKMSPHLNMKLSPNLRPGSPNGAAAAAAANAFMNGNPNGATGFGTTSLPGVGMLMPHGNGSTAGQAAAYRAYATHTQQQHHNPYQTHSSAHLAHHQHQQQHQQAHHHHHHPYALHPGSSPHSQHAQHYHHAGHPSSAAAAAAAAQAAAVAAAGGFLQGHPTIGMTYASYHDRPYPCTEAGCELRFVRSSHVKRHVDTVHRHMRPYQCKFAGCHKYFSRSDNLKQHEKTHKRSP